MDKKTIKENRNTRYFIEAAKNIVLTEGVEALSVKKIADIAGFSAGTLYNYFEDYYDLLFHCILDFFDECKTYVLQSTENSEPGKEKAIDMAKAYSCYFLENPEVYHLAFLKEVEITNKKLKGARYVPEIVQLSAENLNVCVDEGIIAKENLEIIRGLIGNSIHGNLLFFFKRRGAKMSKEELIGKIVREVNFLLEKT